MKNHWVPLKVNTSRERSRVTSHDEFRRSGSYSRAGSEGQDRTVTLLNLSSKVHFVPCFVKASSLCHLDGKEIVPTSPSYCGNKDTIGLSSPRRLPENQCAENQCSGFLELRRFARSWNSLKFVDRGISSTRTVLEAIVAIM